MATTLVPTILPNNNPIYPPPIWSPCEDQLLAVSSKQQGALLSLSLGHSAAQSPWLVASSVYLFIAARIHDGFPLAGFRLFAGQVPNIAPRALNKPSSDPV